MRHIDVHQLVAPMQASYPMATRSTGLGFALGIGRGGAILAPIVIGMWAVLLIDHGQSASVRHTAREAATRNASRPRVIPHPTP